MRGSGWSSVAGRADSLLALLFWNPCLFSPSFFSTRPRSDHSISPTSTTLIGGRLVDMDSVVVAVVDAVLNAVVDAMLESP